MKILLLTTAFALAVLVTNAQNWEPGVVVLSGGDTLTGKLSLSALRSFECEFTNAQGTRKYSPEEVTSFYVPRELYYESARFTEDGVTQLVFMNVVASGRADLFEYKGSFYLRDELDVLTSLRVIEKSQTVNGQEYVARTAEYKLVLRDKLTGCNEAQNLINTTGLSKRPLVKLFNKYNSCFGEAPIEKESRLTPKSKWLVGIDYNLLSTELTSLNNYWKGKSSFDKPYTQQSPGISFYYNPRYMKGLAFHLGLYRTSYTFSAYDEVVEIGQGSNGFSSPMSYSYSFSGKYNAFVLPLMLRYTFFSDKLVQPYVGGGMGLHFVTNFKGTARVYNLTENREARENEIRTYDKTGASLRVHAGVNFKLGRFLLGGGLASDVTNYPVDFRAGGRRYASSQQSTIMTISAAYTIAR